MIGKAFRMRLREGGLEGYRRAHNPLPSALARALHDHGVIKFTIYHHEGTRDLFASVEIEDESRFAQLADLPVCREWWKQMTQYLECEKPGDAKAIEIPLREIFVLGEA